MFLNHLRSYKHHDPFLKNTSVYFPRTTTFSYITMVQWSKSGNLTMIHYNSLIHSAYLMFSNCLSDVHYSLFFSGARSSPGTSDHLIYYPFWCLTCCCLIFDISFILFKNVIFIISSVAPGLMGEFCYGLGLSSTRLVFHLIILCVLWILGFQFVCITSCCQFHVSYLLTCIVGGFARIFCLFWYSETAFSLKLPPPVLRCVNLLFGATIWGLAVALFSVSCWLKGTGRIHEGLGSLTSFVGGSGLFCLFFWILLNTRLYWTWFQVCSVPGGIPASLQFSCLCWDLLVDVLGLKNIYNVFSLLPLHPLFSKSVWY